MPKLLACEDKTFQIRFSHACWALDSFGGLISLADLRWDVNHLVKAVSSRSVDSDLHRPYLPLDFRKRLRVPYSPFGIKILSISHNQDILSTLIARTSRD